MYHHLKRTSRHLLLLLTGCASTMATAQDIQLHYDLGHSLYDDLSGRPNVTTTIEMFKPDKWGSTYLFADIDYYHDGVAGAYWEISREVSLASGSHWAAHVEYDGGSTSIEHTAIASRFQHALLAGAAYNTASTDLLRTFSLQAMYKQYFKGMGRNAFGSFQLTAVWSDTFAEGRYTASGFIDVWYDKDVDGRLVILSEPQFWVNLNALCHTDGLNLSLGAEVEVSNRFVYDDAGRLGAFYAIPTLAAKWTF